MESTNPSPAPATRSQGLPYALLLAAAWGAVFLLGYAIVESARGRAVSPAPRTAVYGALAGLGLALLCHVGPLRRRRPDEPDDAGVRGTIRVGSAADLRFSSGANSIRVALVLFALGWLMRAFYLVMAWPGIRVAQALGLYRRL